MINVKSSVEQHPNTIGPTAVTNCQKERDKTFRVTTFLSRIFSPEVIVTGKVHTVSVMLHDKNKKGNTHNKMNGSQNNPLNLNGMGSDPLSTGFNTTTGAGFEMPFPQEQNYFPSLANIPIQQIERGVLSHSLGVASPESDDHVTRIAVPRGTRADQLASLREALPSPFIRAAGANIIAFPFSLHHQQQQQQKQQSVDLDHVERTLFDDARQLVKRHIAITSKALSQEQLPSP